MRVIASLSAGGAALEDDERALAALRGNKAHRLLLAFAAGRQPTADVLQFVRRAREEFGAGRPIVVALLEARDDGTLSPADPEEHAIWRRSLGTLGDAHLWVETAPEVP